MAEGLLLFYYFPNTSQSASLTAPLKGSLPNCLPLRGGAAKGGGEVAIYLTAQYKMEIPLDKRRCMR